MNFFSLTPSGGSGVTPTLDQVLQQGSVSTHSITTGTSQVNGTLGVTGITTLAGNIIASAIPAYSSGGNTTLVLNTGTGRIEKITTPVITTPTLDQVLTAGNTSAISITTGTATINGSLNISTGIISTTNSSGFVVNGKIKNHLGTNLNIINYTDSGYVGITAENDLGTLQTQLDIDGVPLNLNSNTNEPINTGSGLFTMGGNLSVVNSIFWSGGLLTYSASVGSLYRPTAGSAYDFSLLNGSNTGYILQVPSGTNNVILGGNVKISGLAGHGAGIVAVDNSGNLSYSSGSATPTLDQVLTSGNTSAISITTGTANVNGNLIVSGAGGVGSSFTVGSFILAAATAAYTTGGNTSLVLNTTTGHIEKIALPGTPTLDQVLISGNTSTQNMTVNAGVFNSTVTLNSVATYTTGGNTTLVLNTTTGHIEKLGSGGIPTLDQVLTAGNTSALSMFPGSITTATSIVAGTTLSANGEITGATGLNLANMGTYGTGVGAGGQLMFWQTGGEILIAGSTFWGQATLVAGNATVTDSRIRTGSIIVATHASLGGGGGTIGILVCAGIVTGVSFLIASTNIADTALVNYFVITS